MTTTDEWWHPTPPLAPSAELGRARWELELLTLEAEATGVARGPYALAARPARWRDRLPHETHVDFDGIEADLTRTGTTVGREAIALRLGVLDHLVDGVAAAPTAADVLSRVVTYQAAPTRIPGLTDTLAAATDRMRTPLLSLAARQAGRVRAEAAAQGVPPHRIYPAPLTRDQAQLIDDLTGQVANRATNQVLEVATGAATTHARHGVPDALDAIVQAVDGLSDAGPLNQGSRAANTAGGVGRTAGAGHVDAPFRAYASELIDTATCIPCAQVDGTEYDTEAAAAVDYPFGQFVDCQGGPNCRGMLVYVYEGEAAASIGMPAR